MTYEIEGRLLEVCTCNVLCPCWVGEDPDNKTCDTVIAWGIEKGSIEGVDVAGLTMAVSAHIPKNILIPKSWKAVVFVDERATAEQEAAMLRLFTGQLGGAVADLAGLIGEVVAVERSPISFTVDGGKGQPDDREAGRSRDGAVRGRDRQPDDPRRDGLQHDPGLARSTRARPASTPRTAVRTASRAWTSRTTTRSRATSASRPDGRVETSDVRTGPPARPPSRPGDPRRALVALAVAAWLALWLWEGSPYGHYLHHDGGGPVPLEASLFAVGWLLMIVAMMLPSSVPLVTTFAVLVRRRRHPGLLVVLLLAGYLLVWGGFGLVAWIADRGIHAAVETVPWLAEHPQVIIATTLAIAGLWQFSPMRDRCLDECRSPLGFVMNRWRGVRSGVRPSRWGSPTARSASAAAGR